MGILQGMVEKTSPGMISSCAANRVIFPALDIDACLRRATLQKGLGHAGSPAASLILWCDS
jgi:hypothetical protein